MTRRNRTWRHRARATAVLGTVTAVSLLATLAQAPSPTADAVDSGRTSWLNASGITVNPPGLGAGELSPPSVPLGYIISGNALPQFDITATPRGQVEVAAFARYVQAKYGVDVLPTALRAYAMPRVAAMDLGEADRIGAEMVSTLSARDTSATPEAAPVDLGGVTSALMQIVTAAGSDTSARELAQSLANALDGLDLPRQSAAARDLAAIAATVAGADAKLDAIPTYISTTDASVDAITRALGPIAVPDPSYLLAEAKQVVATLDALVRVKALTGDAVSADPNRLRDEATALLAGVDPPAVDTGSALARVQAAIAQLEADGLLAQANSDVAVAVHNVRRAADDVTGNPPNSGELYKAVVTAVNALEPAATAELRSRLAVIIDDAKLRAQQASAEALVRVVTLLNSVPRDPDGVIDTLRNAIGPLAIDDPAYVVQQVQAALAGLDVMGRIDRLVRMVPLPSEAELRETIYRLVGTIPPLPSVDPATVLAQVTKVLTAQPGVASVSEDTQDAVDDPAHASPVGADLLIDTYGSEVGDLLVLPVGASVDEVSAAFVNKTVAIQTVLVTTPAGPTSGTLFNAAQPPPEQDPAWARRGGHGCVARKQNRTAWYDVCNFWWSLARDGFPSEETFDLEQYGTAKSKSIWLLSSFEVRQWPDKDSSKQNWIQWSPASDMDVGGCRTTTVGVNVAGAALESSHQHCEKWDIDKGADGGRFANTWRGAVKRSERAVASSVSTSVRNGELPRNRVRYDYYAD